MANVNQILPFALAPNARVLDPDAYKALAARVSGFVAGVADETQLNTVWRQSAFVSSMIGQFIADRAKVDVLDDGDIATLENQFVLAVAAVAATVGGDVSNAIQIVQAAGSPFNFKVAKLTTRTDASGSQAGQLVPVMPGLTYVKKSATSNIVAALVFQSYAPIQSGVGNAAATARLASSSGPYADFGINSSFIQSNGSIGGSGTNTPTLVLEGVPPGATQLTLSYRRDDNLSWRTIYNPNSNDAPGSNPNPVAYYFIYEYEPGA